MLPMVVSFYTKDTPYALEVQNLIASCEQFGIKIDVEGIPSYGSWELNCAYKPFFILERLKRHRRPLLWVDADAIFVSMLKQSDAFTADLAVCINDSCAIDHPSKVMSGTIFIAATKEAEELLRLWCCECQKLLLQEGRTSEFWDQEALRNAIFSCPHSARVAKLPPEYIKIFDRPLDSASGPAIIEHYQASRRLKKLVGEAGRGGSNS